MALLCICLALGQWELVEGRGIDGFTSAVIYHLPNCVPVAVLGSRETLVRKAPFKALMSEELAF